MMTKIANKALSFKNRALRLKSKAGQSAVEYVVILAVVAALVMAFKKPLLDQVDGLVGKVFGKISAKANAAGE